VEKISGAALATIGFMLYDYVWTREDIAQ
jgi:hypothetical protein